MPIKCQLCGKELIRITPTHLKKHNYTSKQYRNEFGNDSICSKENKKNQGTSLEKMIKKYGKIEGTRKWEEYKNKQAETNTFEYKHKKYGWSKEQFDAYNKSRAITFENLIKKYGEEEGTRKWEEYRIKQAYSGCKLFYFIEKYGKIEGTRKYKDICYKKGWCRNNQLSESHKCAIRLGRIKEIEQRTGQVMPNYNPNSIPEIEKFGNDNGYNFHHAENGGEVKLDIGYWPDGYDIENNIIVEYFEYWHNKQLKKDFKRLKEIQDHLNCQIFIIWEDENGSKRIENFSDRRN